MLEVTRTCQSCGLNRATFIRIMDDNKLPNHIMLLCLDCVNQLNAKSSVNDEILNKTWEESNKEEYT